MHHQRQVCVKKQRGVEDRTESRERRVCLAFALPESQMSLLSDCAVRAVSRDRGPAVGPRCRCCCPWLLRGGFASTTVATEHTRGLVSGQAQPGVSLGILFPKRAATPGVSAVTDFRCGRRSTDAHRPGRRSPEVPAATGTGRFLWSLASLRRRPPPACLDLELSQSGCDANFRNLAVISRSESADRHRICRKSKIRAHDDILPGRINNSRVVGDFARLCFGGLGLGWKKLGWSGPECGQCGNHETGRAGGAQLIWSEAGVAKN